MKRPAPRRFAGVRVLNKAVDVLETLGGEPAGMALADIAAAAAMPKPTVYRIVATFESRGYLDRTPEGHYRLSRRIFELQPGATTERHLIRAARPVMEDLIGVCKETLNLGVLDGGEVLVIETLESPHMVRMSSKIGNRRYVHSTALGKVLVAGLAGKELARILETRGMPAFTNRTITGPLALAVELEKVRQQGYALDNMENEPDGRCVAAPIHGPGKKVAAALSISGPVPRMTAARAKSFLKPLFSACQTISRAIGGA
jgi:DNA-binding IclR family transcriptional regulator